MHQAWHNFIRTYSLSETLPGVRRIRYTQKLLSSRLVSSRLGRSPYLFERINYKVVAMGLRFRHKNPDEHIFSFCVDFFE